MQSSCKPHDHITETTEATESGVYHNTPMSVTTEESRKFASLQHDKSLAPCQAHRQISLVAFFHDPVLFPGPGHGALLGFEFGHALGYSSIHLLFFVCISIFIQLQLITSNDWP